MQKRDKEIALQRGEAGEEGGEGWRAGGRKGAPFPLMKSLQHIQCHKSFGTVTQTKCIERHMDGIFQMYAPAACAKQSLPG